MPALRFYRRSELTFRVHQCPQANARHDACGPIRSAATVRGLLITSSCVAERVLSSPAFTPADPLQVTISIGGQDDANMFRSFCRGQHVLGINSLNLTSVGA